MGLIAKCGDTGYVEGFSLADTLHIMYLTGSRKITGDKQYGEWCKMTDSYVALKDYGRGKWYRYYFANYKKNTGEPDFERIAHMFFRESGCRPNC